MREADKDIKYTIKVSNLQPRCDLDKSEERTEKIQHKSATEPATLYDTNRLGSPKANEISQSR